MRYVIFPSYQYQDENRPDILEEEGITILQGPTESGLYLIDCDSLVLEKLKSTIEPYYLLMEDFETQTVH
jgi:hypothetical protein